MSDPAKYDKVIARQESAELDDGLPAKCCGRCRDYSDDDGFQRGWCADKNKGVEAVDFCLAFELREF